MNPEELIDMAEEKMLIAYEANSESDRAWLMGMASAYLDVYQRLKNDEPGMAGKAE